MAARDYSPLEIGELASSVMNALLPRAVTLATDRGIPGVWPIRHLLPWRPPGVPNDIRPQPGEPRFLADLRR